MIVMEEQTSRQLVVAFLQQDKSEWTIKQMVKLINQIAGEERITHSSVRTHFYRLKKEGLIQSTRRGSYRWAVPSEPVKVPSKRSLSPREVDEEIQFLLKERGMTRQDILNQMNKDFPKTHYGYVGHALARLIKHRVIEVNDGVYTLVEKTLDIDPAQE